MDLVPGRAEKTYADSLTERGGVPQNVKAVTLDPSHAHTSAIDDQFTDATAVMEPATSSSSVPTRRSVPTSHPSRHPGHRGRREDSFYRIRNEERRPIKDPLRTT